MYYVPMSPAEIWIMIAVIAVIAIACKIAKRRNGGKEKEKRKSGFGKKKPCRSSTRSIPKCSTRTETFTECLRVDDTSLFLSLTNEVWDLLLSQTSFYYAIKRLICIRSVSEC